jgi:hypothetical protein
MRSSNRRSLDTQVSEVTGSQGAAMGAVNALTADGLFEGQEPEFFEVLEEPAAAADAAKPKR